MKILTRKYTTIRGVLSLLMVLVGAVIIRAQDSLPNVPAFGMDVRGILLLNGWAGDYTEHNAELLDMLTEQGIVPVRALDVSVDRPEDLSVIQQTYNASVVLWWSDKDLHFAVFPPAPEDVSYLQEDFAPFIAPTDFAFSGLDTENSLEVVRAVWFYTWGNYSESAAAFTVALEALPVSSEDTALYLYRGLSYARQANYDGAKADFARVSDKSEFAAWAHYNTGSVHYWNYDQQSAIAEYTEAASSTSDRVLLHTIYASRGESYRLSGDTDKAVADYSQAIELDNTSADVYQNRGDIFFADGDYERALLDYDRWLALSPSSTVAWQHRARLFIRTEDYDRAIEDYTTAIQIANDNNALCQCLYVRRAEVHQLAKAYDLAILDYQQSLSYGEYVPAYLGLAEVYLDMNQPEKAMEQIRAAEAISGASANNFLSFGATYEKMGEFEAAADAYLQWINLTQYERIDEDTIASASGSLELEMSQGRAFYIPVTMRAGKTLTVNATSTGADPLIVILDEDGNPVMGSDDVSDTDFSAEISAFKPTLPGQYTIVVSHAGGGSFGTVDFTWSKRR